MPRRLFPPPQGTTTNMEMNQAQPIALPVWKDPQSFVLLEHVRDEARIFFRCRDDAGNPLNEVGCIHFQGVWHVHSERHLAMKGYPDVAATELRSYYLWVPESGLVKALTEKRCAWDPDWKQYDKRQYLHYVIESHDFHYDIVAASAAFSLIPASESGGLLQRWDQV